MQNPTFSGVIISGFILAGLPFAAIAQHWHVASKDVLFAVASDLSAQQNIENVDIQSEINTLDLSELTGVNNIHAWDTVFVHMATGPGKIAYPFGLSREKPVMNTSEHAFAVRGTVTAREGDIITLRYNFETFLPTQEMRPLVANGLKPGAEVELAVNRKAVARLVAVKIDGVRYPYRVIEKPVLKGFTQ